MSTDPASELPFALGFLTVVDQPAQGLIGGYLLVNAHARPLEFHCTAPVRASRAQEILYGPTLGPYLYGDQIGQTLIKTSKLRPLAVFTDCPAALAAAAHLDVSLWLVLPQAEENVPAPARERGVALQGLATRAVTRDEAAICCGGNRVLAATRSGQPGGAASAGALEEPLASMAAALDLSEPFERIRAAIEETQRGAR